MISTKRGRSTVSVVAAALLSVAVPAATLAGTPASPPLIGSFSIGGETTALEPESSLCGFDIAAEGSGTVRFQVFVDEAGEPLRIHLHVMSTGSLSGNGITLNAHQSLNQFLDFEDSTVIEVGLVFKNAGPGTGVALMDRGRLVWSVDPDTGDWLFPPIFEAGPHPQLHGDVSTLCEALTP
jgi:hypothetical protein